MLNNIKKTFIVFLLSSFVMTSVSYPMAHNKIPGMGKSGGGGSKVNISEATSKFTALFAVAFNDYIDALAYLNDAAGNKEAAAKIRAQGKIDLKAKKPENQIAKSANFLSEQTASTKKILEAKDLVISAEGKAAYAKAMPHIIKGTIAAIKMPKEGKNLLDGIKSDRMAMAKLAGLAKVLPKMPTLVKNMTEVAKLTVTVGKKNNIEGVKNAEKEFSKLF